MWSVTGVVVVTLEKYEPLSGDKFIIKNRKIKGRISRQWFWNLMEQVFIIKHREEESICGYTKPWWNC